MPAARIDEIDDWIEEPFSAVDAQTKIINSLFGPKLIYASLQDTGFEPRHDELFKGLAQGTCPPTVLDYVSQSTEPDRFRQVAATPVFTARNPDGTVAQVPATPIFSDLGLALDHGNGHAGNAYGFIANCQGSWVDVDAVLRHFDEFMARLGRTDRAFRLSLGRDDDPCWAFSSSATTRDFRELVRRLGVPLYERT